MNCAWLVRRRHRKVLAAAYEDRRARMPWLQLCAALHHTQHPGQRRDNCAVCNPDKMLRLLDEMSPLPTENPR